MMRSMFSGVTGLRVHQTKMDVIANNIANVNTTGFKPSRVTFHEAFNQTMSGASKANAATGRGGTNPMQIGLGVNMGSIATIMEPGTAQRTGGSYDLMIQGDGFFVVGDAAGRYFTRAGDFAFDRDGNMINYEGMHVQGWKADSNGVIQKGQVRDIVIEGDNNYMPPQMTSKIKFEGNLNYSTDPVKESTISFFDSLGNEYVVDTKYVFDSERKAWQLYMGQYAYPNDDRTKGVLIDYSATDANNSIGTDGEMDINISFVDPEAATGVPRVTGDKYVKIGKDMALDTDGNYNYGTNSDNDVMIKFNNEGYAVLFNDDETNYLNFSKMNLTITDLGNQLNPEGTFKEIAINYGELTQFGNTAQTTMQSITQDGNQAGTLSGLSLGSDGVVTGRYSNGTTKTLAQIAIATFQNPAGLEKVGSNLFVATANSGSFDGIGSEGNFMTGALEMSQVDLANEFVEMITTQRGFQANSRIISTSDEMLQELVNLKR